MFSWATRLISVLILGFWVASVGPAIANGTAEANKLNSQVNKLISAGRFAEAIPIAKLALAMWEQLLGKDNIKLAGMLHDLGVLHKGLDRNVHAVRFFKKSLRVREKANDRSSIEFASTLSELATIQHGQGRFADAERGLRRALKISRGKLGASKSHNANVLASLAVTIQSQGRYNEAESLYKRSLQVLNNASSSNDTDTARVLSGLASLYWLEARYAEALAFAERSLKTLEEANGGNDSSLIDPLNAIAAIYTKQNRFADAEKLFKRALGITESRLGLSHPQRGLLLNNIASLYQDLRRYSEAEEYYTRSLSNGESFYGRDHPEVAVTLSNLANLYQRQGRYGESEQLLKRSHSIIELKLGTDHLYYATSRHSLAELQFNQGKWQQAYENYKASTVVLAKRTRLSAQTLGRGVLARKRSDAARHSKVFKRLIKSAYRLSQSKLTKTAKLRTVMFGVAQQALVSDAAAALAKMAARHATKNKKLAISIRERQDLVGEWQRRDMARSVAFSQPVEKRHHSAEARNIARLAEIDQRVAEIDRDIAKNFPNYAALASPEPQTIQQIQTQLRASEALILFLDTEALQPAPEETFIWVITKDKSRWVRSEFGTNALRDQVDALRCGLDYEGAWNGSRCFDLLGKVYTATDRQLGKPLPFELSRSFQLYTSLFGQFEDLIKDKDLLIIPSGPLTKLPFQVLVASGLGSNEVSADVFGQAAWLAKRHAITVLPSVAALTSLRTHARASQATKPFGGFGNPLLNGPDGRYSELAKAARKRVRCKRKTMWDRVTSNVGIQALFEKRAFRAREPVSAVVRRQTPLPETADELCAVAESLGARISDVLIGEWATERRIKKLSDLGHLAKYRVLHFATHGVLAGQLKGSNEPGLILTPPPEVMPNDDGFLSATEVAGLKLDADWVVLSACNTAGSENENAEALSGLAKAFFYAGARALLVSHWYVDSHATVSLMTKAFTELQREPKIGRAEALRNAMLALMRDKERNWHPEFWAPFVVVGEGGS